MPKLNIKKRITDGAHWFFYEYSTDGSITRVCADIVKAIGIGLRSIKETFATARANSKGEEE